MPLIAAGTWQYNDSQAAVSVSAALRAGFRHIDTAFDYSNQAGVGQAIRKSGLPRGEVFIETKVPGCGLSAVVSTSRCYDDTAKVLEEDLRLLNVSHVDLVILHFPPLRTMIMRTCHFSCAQVRDQWRAMEEFYTAGKARAIGVSNYCPSCFACLDDGHAKVYPMVNQVEYYIGMGLDASGFRSFAEKKGVVIQAYSPLGNKPWKHGADEEILKGKLTTKLAKAHGKSTIQVALKWLVQHSIPVVTKSSNLEHLEQNIDLWSWNLTAAEMQEADAYHAFGLPSFACNWAEHRDSAEVLI